MGIANEDVSSTMSKEDLDEVRVMAEFGDDVELIIPSKKDRPENCPDDLVCFYMYPFTIGYTIELSPLTKAFLDKYQLSPGADDAKLLADLYAIRVSNRRLGWVC